MVYNPFPTHKQATIIYWTNGPHDTLSRYGAQHP